MITSYLQEQIVGESCLLFNYILSVNNNATFFFMFFLFSSAQGIHFL